MVSLLLLFLPLSFFSQKKGGEGRAPKGALPQNYRNPLIADTHFFCSEEEQVRRIQLWWRSLIESVSSWTCASFTLSRAQQTWLGKLGEEVERSLRRRTTHDHVQRAFGRGNNSKRLGLRASFRREKRHATGRVKR